MLDGGLVAERDLLVRRPLAPLHAIDLAEVVFALTERVGQPLGVFVGVLVPDLAAQGAELAGVVHATQEAHISPIADLKASLRVVMAGKPLQVETQHRARQADGACRCGWPVWCRC
jgi:hypothetical protein